MKASKTNTFRTGKFLLGVLPIVWERGAKDLQPKPLYRSHFYGTEYEIWTDFGPVGNTGKKDLGPIISNFLGQISMFSWAKNFKICFFLNTLASALKSCIIFLFFYFYFFALK